MMKRFLTLILCAAMIATMFCIVPVSVSAGDSDIGEVPGSYAPEGTAITTAEEFAAMTAGGKYYLANDITITATWNAGAERPAAAADATAFAGTLDGNGKTITTSVALFVNITGSTVKNLTVAGDVAAFDTDSNSAIGCYAKGEVNFENVCNKANVLGGKAVGALIGYGATGTVLTIKNCVNNGNVTGSSQVGGLAGYIQDDVVVIENCENNGVVTSTASYGGGIIGRFGRDAADTNSTITVKNCVNNGAVNTNGAQTGGIIGYGLGIITIEDCTNYGTLTNTNGATGGIAGILGHKDKANLHGSYIRRCVNYGDVTGTTLAAGIVARSGRAATASGHIYAVDNCENHGDIYLNIPAPSEAVSTYAGGTVGYAWGGAGCKTVNCINTGSINVNNPENPAAAVSLYVAGTLGYVSGASYEIKNNINAGAINITGPAPTTLVLTSYNKNETATIFTIQLLMTLRQR